MVAFDLIIRGGEVVDGTRGATPRRADVGVAGRRIVAVEDLSDVDAPKQIDATELVITPGFIDTHVHSESSFLLGDDDRFGSSLQGVTTHLTAPDGFGWARVPRDRARSLWRQSESIYGAPSTFEPFWATVADYKDAFTGRLPVNLALQVPHHAVRCEVMGFEQRLATDNELSQMADVARAWLDEGAVSIALGLDYLPGGFSDTRELKALAEVVASRDGALQSHMRFTELGQLAAWKEMLEVGRATGIRVNISHATLNDELLDVVASVRGEVDLALDTYLYPAGCTHLMYLIPTVHQQEVGEFLEGLKQPERRQAALAHFERAFENPRWMPDKMVIAATGSGRFEGSTLADVMAAWDLSPAETSLRLIEEERGDVLNLDHKPIPDDVFAQRIRDTLGFEQAMIASDGIYRGAGTHPRGWGAFSRVLGQFSRDDGVLAFGEAVHRMSGLPAQRYGLKGKGVVAVGADADLVVLDPATVAAGSTWRSPRRGPEGVRHVFVNGTAVVANGKATRAEPGTIVA
ncbi:MAG: amidohydrolase family protein [Nitriliruptoraceae bacterium]